MWGDRRARLTLIDVIFMGVSLFVIGIVAGPVFEILDDQAGVIGTGPAFMFRIVVPGLIVTLMVVIWRTSLGGGGGLR